MYRMSLVSFTLVVCLFGSVASAQSPLISSELEVNGSNISIKSHVPADINTGLRGNKERKFMDEYVATHLLISNKENKCTFKLSSFAVNKKGSNFSGIYTCDTNIDSIDHLKIENALYTEIMPESNHKMTVSSSIDRREIIFTPQKTVFPRDFAGHATNITIPESNGDGAANGSQEESQNNFIGSTSFYIIVVMSISAIIGAVLIWKRRR